MKVTAFNGSPRKDGNTVFLLNTALAQLKARGFETELVHIAQKPLRGCTACGGCFKTKNRKCVLPDDGMNGYIAKLAESDGIIIGSPTYFADLTPETKAFIDRAGMVGSANGKLYRRKAGAAVAAVRRAGSIHVFDSINHFFTITEMIIPGSSYWNMGIGMKRGEAEKDEEGIQTMQRLGENMAWLLAKLHTGKDAL